MPGGEQLEYKGFVNKIGNRTKAPNGQNSYVVEFTSSTVRQNENIFITHRYNSVKPAEIVRSTVNRMNERSEIPVKIDKFKGDGLNMNYIASRWHPIRNIQYVQKHGVPLYRGGATTFNPQNGEGSPQKGQGTGTGGFLFFETLKGYRFGSSVEFFFRQAMLSKMLPALSSTLATFVRFAAD